MRIIRKLKNKQGASAVLGILFFLICFFVTSVIMSAASVNISRARTQREEQQAYLAINAADELIRNELLKIESFYAEEVVEKHDCHICENQYYAPVIGNPGTAESPNPNYDAITKLNLKTSVDGEDLVLETCKLGPIMADVAEKIYSTQTLVDWSVGTAFDLDKWSRNFDIEADDMKTVHVKVTADKNYNLYFELSVDTRFAVSHVSILKANATVKKTNNGTVKENACPYVTLSSGDVRKGHPIAGQYEETADGDMIPKFKDYNSNVVTYKTEVSWHNFKTSKGNLQAGKETTTTS